MNKKVKMVLRLIEDVSFILLGVTNWVVGVCLWDFHVLCTISLFALSIIVIMRGVTDLWDMKYPEPEK